MIGYNNEAPKAVNNVGQFGATEGSIGAYKSAAEYASDAKYWALLSQTKYSSVEEILVEVERLYAQGRLLEEDIKQLKNDFESQEQALLGLIQSTGTAIDNTNAATELSKEATQNVLAQLDIISNMSVQTTLLPPGSLATGSYDNTTGVFSFGIPEGKPGRDGTDGTISDIGSVPVGTPVVDDYGFYVDKDDGGLYRADMSDIANLIPSVRSVSINGGTEQTGSVVFDSVSTFNGRKGAVVAESGDYTAAQVGAFSVSNNLSEITNTSEAIKNIGLADYGIATKSLVKLSSFDWQTFVFTNSARYYVDYSAMTNRPEGLTYSSETGLFIEVIGVVDLVFEVRVVPSTAQNGKYTTYAVRAQGTIGNRTFWLREELSSALPVTISQGGTGATTAASARTNLGLGLVATESIVPITKGGTGSTSAENARLALVAAKSGDNSDITSMLNVVTFAQSPVVPKASESNAPIPLGQLSGEDGANLIGSSSYSDIRSYNGDADRILCYGRSSIIDNSSGWFFKDVGDLTSPDNDGTVLVDVLGRRWKREYSGPVDVRWFGVKADGTTDDTAAANKALGTLQHVRFPAGTIIISAPLIFGTQIVEGAGTYPNGEYGTIIQCTGDHDAFEHASVGYQPGGEIKGFWINYQAGKPTSTTRRSKGINFGTSDTLVDPLTGGVTCFTIENVIVRGAYYGFYDVTSAYLMEYKNCWAWDCFQGFVKDYGTTVKYSTCYSLDCYASWKFRYCHVATLVNCAYDGTDIFGDLVPFYAEQCPGLTITGMQHESSKVSVSGRSDFTLVNCNSAKIIGFSIPSWTNSAGADGEAYLFRFTNSNVDISGINLSGFVSGGTSDVSSTGANSYTILANNGSKVNVSASNLPLISGSPFSYTFSASSDSRIDYSSNCTFTGLINGLVFTNGLSQPAYIDYNVTLAAGALSFLGTVTVPNVKYGDFIHIDASSGLSGIDIFGSRAGGSVGSVNVFMVNHNDSQVSVSGQAVIRFMRP